MVRSSTTAVGAAVVPLWSGSKKLHPLQFAVVPLQPFQNMKLPQLLQTDSEFNETKFVGKLATRPNTILIEITIRSKLEKSQKKKVRTLPRIGPIKPPTSKTQ